MSDGFSPLTPSKIFFILISLCMIARDEERFLARCLGSVRAIVDEIIVVDTGSTDGTLAIAAEFQASVYHMDWQDDFARARNESLQHAPRDAQRQCRSRQQRNDHPRSALGGITLIRLRVHDSPDDPDDANTRGPAIADHARRQPEQRQE